MPQLTTILKAVESGDPIASDRLLPLLYDELRSLAAARLIREAPGQTIQPTALVHEAYLRLVGDDNPGWENRRHFFGAAAEAMRRILVERARHKATERAGGNFKRLDLDGELPADDTRSTQLLALDEALGELELHDPQAAKIVKLRYFAGLSHRDAASALLISRRAADRLWSLAKAWLYRRLEDSI